jgi:hypothetical protein
MMVIVEYWLVVIKLRANIVMAILFVLTPITFFNKGSLSRPCINWYCFKPFQASSKLCEFFCKEETQNVHELYCVAN